MIIRQQGFNIIEMMVGLTIGLLGLLAVTQVMITFNQQRNTTTQTMEAQSNGAMAAFMLERDLAQGGYGLMALKNCQLIQWFWDPPVVPPAITKACESDPSLAANKCGVQDPYPRGVAPAIITTHGSASDEIEINYGQSSSGAPGSQVTATQGLFTDPFRVSSTAGFDEGDTVVADVIEVDGGTGMNNHFCTMSRLTKVNALVDPTTLAALPTATQFTLEHDTQAAIAALGLPADEDEEKRKLKIAYYNPKDADLGAADKDVGWKPAQIKTVIANLGGYVSKRYIIGDGDAVVEATDDALRMGAFPRKTDVETAVDGIVYMKAQYGLDKTVPFANGKGDATAGDGVVDEWTNSLTNITSGGRQYLNRIIAVRLGIVARSPLYEKDPVDAPATLTVLPAISTPATAAVTWDIPDTHYRYKSYYIVVPFRNVIWAP